LRHGSGAALFRHFVQMRFRFGKVAKSRGFFFCRQGNFLKRLGVWEWVLRFTVGDFDGAAFDLQRL
jgi:hypothetical protein